MIKVHVAGSPSVKEVTAEEAQRILEGVYLDSMGGFVADYTTNAIISKIDDDVSDILIIEQMLGGG
jgi:hypothetical protein